MSQANSAMTAIPPPETVVPTPVKGKSAATERSIPVRRAMTGIKKIATRVRTPVNLPRVEIVLSVVRKSATTAIPLQGMVVRKPVSKKAAATDESMLGNLVTTGTKRIATNVPRPV